VDQSHARRERRDRRPLRIAMVHLSDFRFDSRIQRQAHALAERGDTVDLVGLGERTALGVGGGLIRVHPVGENKPAGGVRGYAGGYARFLASAMRRLTALDRQYRFDLVEIHNMPNALTFAGIVPKLRGASMILNLHDTFPELMASKFNRRDDGWEVRLIQLEERVSANMADALITVTNEARMRLAERGVGVGRTYVVMNSPDERTFGPPRQPRTLPETGEIRIVYHGGLARRFGVETLVRAFQWLPGTASRVTLRIFGIGEELPSIRRLADAIAPDRIEVFGPVPVASIPAELEAANLAVVPTLHDRFGELLLPVKLLEFVHMGLPVVASRLEGIASYFSDRQLRLFTPGDPVDLATAIAAVCDDPAAARQRAVRATERLKAISWDKQRARYLSLIDRLTGDGPGELSPAPAARHGSPRAGERICG
jgi:glycosyltransferase involved in cell wall biosynthesis